MADKLKLSKKSSEQLNDLSNRLDIRRNIVCRLALSCSLSLNDPISYSTKTDTDGYEFNKSTIMGSDEILFRALCTFVQNKKIENDFFNIVVKIHIERGLEIMHRDFQTVNSPIEYLSHLLNID